MALKGKNLATPTPPSPLSGGGGSASGGLWLTGASLPFPGHDIL